MPHVAVCYSVTRDNTPQALPHTPAADRSVPQALDLTANHALANSYTSVHVMHSSVTHPGQVVHKVEVHARSEVDGLGAPGAAVMQREPLVGRRCC